VLEKNRSLLEKLIQSTDIVVNLIAYANHHIYVTSPIKVFKLNFIEKYRNYESVYKTCGEIVSILLS